jgi:uncharacterized membrane protein (DUF4010 family)
MRGASAVRPPAANQRAHVARKDRGAMMPAAERLLVALLVGILIGLDRERAEARKERPLFAGIRTFPLIALSGAVPLLLPPPIDAALAVVGFLAIASIALVSYARTVAGHVGATTEVAAVATFLLGALAGAGHLALAGAAGVTVAILLAAKPPLEAFSRALRSEELAAVLELAVITVIVLPLLPNSGYGPWQVLNPREIWLVVVLVSALSFAGFVLIRLLGPHRGMLLAGGVGGLVSSTAVTMAMAERSRAAPRLARVAAAGTAFAAAIMCVRVGLLAAAVKPAVLPLVGPVVVAMAAAGSIAAWVLARGQDRSRETEEAATVANPFSLPAALLFAVLYTVVLLVVRGARELLGERGLYLAAALSAVADVDAPTIAFARLGPIDGDWRGPATAIVIAAMSNTIVKLGLGVGLGAGGFRLQVAAALGAILCAGIVASTMVLAPG